MIVAIQGTRNFNDYNIFLRAMGTAIRHIKDGDNQITVFTAGPAQINSFAMEFVNISERSLKGRGIKIRLIKIPPIWIQNNIHDIAYLAYFSKPKEPIPAIVELADANNVEVGVYRL